MENDGKLTKREYTLLLKHNMSNISKRQWWMPLISSYPKADSTVADNKLLFGRKWEVFMMPLLFWVDSGQTLSDFG